MSGCLESLRGVKDPKAKRAVRWTPMAAALAATVMALEGFQTLGDRCRQALECLDSDLTRGRRVGRTYNGLIKALARQEELVPTIRDGLRKRVRALLESIPRSSGWMLLAVDGSKEALPRTEDNEERFGIGDNGAVPQAFITAIVEVHTGAPWDYRIGPANADEKQHLIQMIDRLPEEALVLADRNFVGHEVWSKLDKAGRSFLIRVGGNVTLRTGLYPESVLERRGDIVYVWPRGRQDDAAPLRLRLIRVGSKSSPVYLLTNVLDRKRLSKRAAGAIYRTRWGVELFYRTFKRTMGLVKLRSRAGHRAALELEWALIAATIAVLIGTESLEAGRKDPRRMSPAAVLRALRSVTRRCGKDAARTGRSLRAALKGATRDLYRRRVKKASRHRPVTKATPKHLGGQPPRLREATPHERALARERYPAPAA